MGTNFYWSTDPLPTGDPRPAEYDSDEPTVHIGKRSAAGPFCWDCDETLIVGGKAKIHHSGGSVYERCPKCGKEPEKIDGFSHGATAIEFAGGAAVGASAAAAVPATAAGGTS